MWGPNAVEHSHYLRIYMGHLRQKLEADPARPQHLLTETGIGYRFMPESRLCSTRGWRFSALQRAAESLRGSRYMPDAGSLNQPQAQR